MHAFHAKKNTSRSELFQVLNKKYTTKVAGNLNGHLGKKVNEYEDGALGLSQPKTLKAIFDHFDIADDDPGVHTPGCASTSTTKSRIKAQK